MVRSPRSPRFMSSGPTQSPIAWTVSMSRGHVAALAATTPSIRSEWPPIYLLPDWIERSTPLSSARAARVRRRRDRGHVLNLEREGARRLHIDCAGVGLNQRGNARTDQRIV